MNRYLCGSLRLREGDRFIGFNGEGHEREYQLAQLDGELIAEAVGEVYEGRSGAPVALCFAIPKGDKLDSVARQITELGVAELHLWSASRSVGVWKHAKVQQKLDRLTRVTREAARQSGRADQLSVSVPASLSSIIERHQSVPLRIFLDPHVSKGWPSDLALKATGGASALKCILLVGPEGGISPDERAQLTEAGWRGLCLASPVLRTETAGVVACALALDRLGYLA